MPDATDDLIEEVTVDAYGSYEQLSAFRQAFEDSAHFPFTGRVVGVDVQVEQVDYDGETGAASWPSAGATARSTLCPCSM
ncbi:MAG: hypothetical protein ACRDYF_11625 [Acidimicrobiia bacterium]